MAAAEGKVRLVSCALSTTSAVSAGRFYSKLHRRWLEERKGAGLRRVLSLLLTLAWGGDSREVVSWGGWEVGGCARSLLPPRHSRQSQY